MRGRANTGRKSTTHPTHMSPAFLFPRTVLGTFSRGLAGLLSTLSICLIFRVIVPMSLGDITWSTASGASFHLMSPWTHVGVDMDVLDSSTFPNTKGLSEFADTRTPSLHVTPSPNKNLPGTTKPSRLINEHVSTFPP